MGAHLPEIKEYLRGANPRIASADTMIKTTPPGHGSRLLRVTEDNPVYAACARTVALDDGQVRLMVTGPFDEADLGVACYHSKVGAVELCLNHLVDGRGEYVVVDMTAGSDSFASGMFTRFDMTFLVAEPTRKGVSVYRQYKEYARDFGVTLRVIGNKVQGAGRPRLPAGRGGRRPARHRRPLRLGACDGEGPSRLASHGWRSPTAGRSACSTPRWTPATRAATGAATPARWCTST